MEWFRPVSESPVVSSSDTVVAQSLLPGHFTAGLLQGFSERSQLPQ